MRQKRCEKEKKKRAQAREERERKKKTTSLAQDAMDATSCVAFPVGSMLRKVVSVEERTSYRR